MSFMQLKTTATKQRSASKTQFKHYMISDVVVTKRRKTCGFHIVFLQPMYFQLKNAGIFTDDVFKLWPGCTRSTVSHAFRTDSL